MGGPRRTRVQFRQAPAPQARIFFRCDKKIVLERSPHVMPPSGVVKRGKTKSDESTQPVVNAKDVRKAIKGRKGGSWLPSVGQNVRVGILFALVVAVAIGLVYFLWPSASSGRMATTAADRIPSHMDTLRAEVTLPAGIPAAQVLDYIRTPQTWVYWRSATNKVHGAIDHIITKPGMAFTERAMVDGKERDISWVSTYTGSDGPTRTRVSLTGTVTGICELRTSFVISYAAAAAAASSRTVAVKQILSFGAKGMSLERKALLGQTLKEQMVLSLKRLRLRMSK